MLDEQAVKSTLTEDVKVLYDAKKALQAIYA